MRDRKRLRLTRERYTGDVPLRDGEIEVLPITDFLPRLSAGDVLE